MRGSLILDLKGLKVILASTVYAPYETQALLITLNPKPKNKLYYSPLICSLWYPYSIQILPYTLDPKLQILNPKP